VLDGELVVWNRERCTFDRFGSLKNVVSAVVEGKAGEGDVVRRDDVKPGHPDPMGSEALAKDLQARMLNLRQRSGVIGCPISTASARARTHTHARARARAHARTHTHTHTHPTH
jgi:hypothetical protein